MVFPSGEQYEISAAGYVAVVTESGAALRVLRHHGRDLVNGFPEAEMSTAEESGSSPLTTVQRTVTPPPRSSAVVAVIVVRSCSPAQNA